MKPQQERLRPIPARKGLFAELARVGFVACNGMHVHKEAEHWQWFAQYGDVRVDMCAYPPREIDRPHMVWTCSVFKCNPAGTLVAEAVMWTVNGWKIHKFKVAEELFFSDVK